MVSSRSEESMLVQSMSSVHDELEARMAGVGDDELEGRRRELFQMCADVERMCDDGLEASQQQQQEPAAADEPEQQQQQQQQQQQEQQQQANVAVVEADMHQFLQMCADVERMCDASLQPQQQHQQQEPAAADEPEQQANVIVVVAEVHIVPGV